MSDTTNQDYPSTHQASEKATPPQPAKPAPGTADKRKHIDEAMQEAEKHRGNGY